MTRKVCPECNEPQLEKLVSAAGFRLKGGGWYETDFKSGKQKNLANKDGKKSDSSSTSGSSGDKTSSSSGTAKAD